MTSEHDFRLIKIINLQYIHHHNLLTFILSPFYRVQTNKNRNSYNTVIPVQEYIYLKLFTIVKFLICRRVLKHRYLFKVLRNRGN